MSSQFHLALMSAVALSACGSEPDALGSLDDSAAPVAFCESELHYQYDPAAELSTWPDDWWTVEDPSTNTGLRLALEPGDPALALFPEEYQNLLVDLGTLDGAGTTPELVFQLNRGLPEDVDALEVILLTDAGDGDWDSHEVQVSTIDYGRTLMVRPWRPLPPASRGVLAVRSQPSDGSDCIEPSETLQALLTDPGERLHTRYVDGLDALGWEAADVGIMTVFTTQSAGLQDAEVIADVDGRDISLDGPMSCITSETRGFRRCDGTVTVADYRDEETGVVPADEPIAVREEYALPVRLWLPDDDGAGAPYPVAMCGHGLTGSRNQCSFLGELGADLGVATMAVDAIEHGDHPDRTQNGDSLDVVMALCGFELLPPSLDALRLRDNFRQSAWDKFQVLRAVQAGWDVDGDGVDDLDPEHLQYAGASLGGIMGPQLLALMPELETGVLIVPGGGLLDLFIHSDSFGIIATGMTPPDWEPEDLTRVVPLLQALVDAGDPLVFAAEVSARRSRGEDQAHVALLMAYEDAIVPNISTTRLAQAFEVATVGTELIEIPGVPQVDEGVAGNLADGATGGLLQLDRTQPTEGGAWESADHSYVHESIQTADVLEPFILTAIAGGTPELADPYLDQ